MSFVTHSDPGDADEAHMAPLRASIRQSQARNAQPGNCRATGCRTDADVGRSWPAPPMRQHAAPLEAGDVPTNFLAQRRREHDAAVAVQSHMRGKQARKAWAAAPPPPGTVGGTSATSSKLQPKRGSSEPWWRCLERCVTALDCVPADQSAAAAVPAKSVSPKKQKVAGGAAGVGGAASLEAGDVPTDFLAQRRREHDAAVAVQSHMRGKQARKAWAAAPPPPGTEGDGPASTATTAVTAAIAADPAPPNRNLYRRESAAKLLQRRPSHIPAPALAELARSTPTKGSPSHRLAHSPPDGNDEESLLQIFLGQGPHKQRAQTDPLPQDPPPAPPTQVAPQSAITGQSGAAATGAGGVASGDGIGDGSGDGTGDGSGDGTGDGSGGGGGTWLHGWLVERELTKLEAALVSAEVESLEDLKLLSRADLAELGIPLGPRNKLLAAIGHQTSSELRAELDQMLSAETQQGGGVCAAAQARKAPIDQRVGAAAMGAAAGGAGSASACATLALCGSLVAAHVQERQHAPSHTSSNGSRETKPLLALPLCSNVASQRYADDRYGC